MTSHGPGRWCRCEPSFLYLPAGHHTLGRCIRLGVRDPRSKRLADPRDQPKSSRRTAADLADIGSSG